MFPFSIEGSIVAPRAEVGGAVDRLQAALTQWGAKAIERRPDVLSFRGQAFRLRPVWYPLHFVDQCEVSVKSELIAFRCSTKVVAALCIGAMIVLGGFIYVNNPISIEIVLIVVAFGWLWVFGVNYLLCSILLRRFFGGVVRREADG
jgi:hypothetical protein